MTIGPTKSQCQKCGESWWDSHACGDLILRSGASENAQQTAKETPKETLKETLKEKLAEEGWRVMEENHGVIALYKRGTAQPFRFDPRYETICYFMRDAFGCDDSEPGKTHLEGWIVEGDSNGAMYPYRIGNKRGLGYWPGESIHSVLSALKRISPIGSLDAAATPSSHQEALDDALAAAKLEIMQLRRALVDLQPADDEEARVLASITRRSLNR